MMTPEQWQDRHQKARAEGKWLYATHRSGVRGRVIGVSRAGVRMRFDTGVELDHPDDLRSVRAR